MSCHYVICDKYIGHYDYVRLILMDEITNKQKHEKRLYDQRRALEKKADKLTLEEYDQLE